MKNKKLFYTLVPVVVCVVALGIFMFARNKSNKTSGEWAETVAANNMTDQTKAEGDAGKKLLDKPGTYSDNVEYNELTIGSSDVVVENAKVKTLKIDATVGNGDVTLRNMSVSDLQIYGGGKNSIHIENVIVDKMIVARKEDAVRVVVDSKSTINTASLDQPSVLEVAGRIAQLNVNAKSSISINGVVDNMYVADGAKDSDIRVEGSITNLVTVSELSNLNGRDKVGAVNTDANAVAQNQLWNNNPANTVIQNHLGTQANGNNNRPSRPGVKPPQSNGNTSGGNRPGGNRPGGNTPGGNTPGGNTPGGNVPSDKIVIERVQSEYAKVIVTLSAPTSAPIGKDQISILCNTGGSDMTILNVTTKDNKVYEISTAVYKDNEYEIYMTLPDGSIISKVFEVRSDAPALTNIDVTRINEGNADLFFVSDAQGEFYYILQEKADAKARSNVLMTGEFKAAVMRNDLSFKESNHYLMQRTILKAGSGVPTAEQIKAEGTKTSLKYQANNIRINGLKPGVGYDIYYLAIDENGKESLVQGPVHISSTVAKEPQLNPIKIVNAKATTSYFDITLSGKPSEELTLANFSISCPADSKLHLGRMEKRNDTQYRLHMQEGYFFKDMNNYTVIITYKDQSISKHKFFVDLSWPSFSLPTVTRTSDTEAQFEFRSNEKGKMWYICSEKDRFDSSVTVDQVISQGTMVTFSEGTNRIQLEGVKANSKSLFYVYEDMLGNRPKFVDATKIPEKKPEVPQPPQESVNITGIKVSTDYGPKNECTLLSLTFDYDVQADQMYVGASEIEISQKGSGTVYTGHRDIEVATNADGVEVKLIKNMGMILPDGEYQIKVHLNKGTATKTFTVKS